MSPNKFICYTVLLFLGLSTFSVLYAAENTQTAKVVSVTNPAKTYGVEIGDKLSRKIVLQVPAPFKIADTAFPKKGSKHDGVELVYVDVAVDQKNELTLYTLSLSYQSFVNSSKPTVMYLPAVKVALTGGAEVAALDIPAWGFWFSPIVYGDIRVAQKNIQPEFLPPMVDGRMHQSLLIAFASLLILSLIALVYINADAKWLPFMGGAFAKAHRQLKRLANSPATKTIAHEKQALVYVHQAFNQHFGANMFAYDIERFINKHAGFKHKKDEIAHFFDSSNQSLYANEQRSSQKIIADLVLFSKSLRDCERGV